MTNTVTCIIVIEGDDFGILLKGEAANHIIEIQNAREITDNDVDEALLIGIQESEKSIKQHLQKVSETITKLTLSKKSIENQKYTIQLKAGEKLLKLKELIDSHYCDYNDEIIPAYFRPYLFEIKLPESTARKYMYLAMYDINEEYYYLGSDIINQLIEHCKKEKTDAVNEKIEDFLSKNSLDDKTEINKKLRQYIEAQKCLRQAKIKNVDLPENLVEDVFFTGVKIETENLDQLKGLSETEKEDYLEAMLLNGQSNSVESKKREPSIDMLVDQLYRALFDNWVNDKNQTISNKEKAIKTAMLIPINIKDTEE